MRFYTWIGKKLRTNATIDYVICCAKQKKDKAFNEFVRGQGYSILEYENDELSQKTNSVIYYIRTGNSFSGFGAQLRRTIDALYFADCHNMVPVVEYTKEFSYSENHEVNGTNNSFEYYFDKVSSIDSNEICKSMYVSFKESHRGFIDAITDNHSWYVLNEEYITICAQMIKKYIHINEKTNEYIASSMKKKMPDQYKYIGVHYRGSDFNVGYKNHPIVLTVNDYFEKIDNLLTENDNMKIFLATDDQNALSQFTEKYGNRVVYYEDVLRSNDMQGVHHMQNERENHRYKLGLEILRDIISLSSCDYLVAGLSQVSYCARMFKKSNGNAYIKCELISKGIVE